MYEYRTSSRSRDDKTLEKRLTKLNSRSKKELQQV
jgi:hypothetical protein